MDVLHGINQTCPSTPFLFGSFSPYKLEICSLYEKDSNLAIFKTTNTWKNECKDFSFLIADLNTNK